MSSVQQIFHDNFLKWNSLLSIGTPMALDLSNVNDTSFDNVDAFFSADGVLLSADAIVLPGRNDILFHVSESGQLILANFFIDFKSGIPILRRRLDPKSQSNLIPVDRNGYCSDDAHSFNYGSSDLSGQRLHAFRSCDPDVSTSVARGNVHDHSPVKCTSDATEGRSEMCSTDQPLDATTHRHAVVPEPGSVVPKELDLKEIGSFLSTNVIDILKAHGYPWDETTSMQDLVIKGHNFSALVRLVQRLRQHRISKSLTQQQLSLQLMHHFNYAFSLSQVLLSRFERFLVTVRSAFKLSPYIESWLDSTSGKTSLGGREETGSKSMFGRKNASAFYQKRKLLRLGIVEDQAIQDPFSDRHDHESLAQDLSDSQLGGTPGKPSANVSVFPGRRKRTHFSDATVALLAAEYKKNPKPQGAQLTRLAMKTGCHREAIRVWFCNRRQTDARLQATSNPSGT